VGILGEGMSEIKTPPATRKYRENFDKIFKGERLMVDAPLDYNTDNPLYMSEGKVVMVIKTLDGDIAL